MSPMSDKPGLILVSGGLDSATVLALAISRGYAPHALTFSYGQRHAVEISASRALVERAGVLKHLIVDIDLRTFGNSALTDDIEVPKGRSEAEMKEEMPVTYVPARNTIFLAYALAYAEVHGIRDIFIGVNSVDYSGYPDCRPEFIEAFEKMANLATAAAVGKRQKIIIHSPLIVLRKAQIIRLGTDLGVDYSLTISCYDPDSSGAACGHCDSCSLRKKGFIDAGVDDPTIYS